MMILLTALASAHISLSPATAHAAGTKGLVNIFPRSQLVCGKGVTTPQLIWGRAPFSACILKGTKQKGVFGWNEWFQ